MGKLRCSSSFLLLHLELVIICKGLGKQVLIFFLILHLKLVIIYQIHGLLRFGKLRCPFLGLESLGKMVLR